MAEKTPFDWVAHFKEQIKTDTDRHQEQYEGEVKRAFAHFEHFLTRNLPERAMRGEHISPTAFHDEVLNYPNQIAAPLVAAIMMQATLDRGGLRSESKKQLEDGEKHIQRTYARALEIMETHIRPVAKVV